jgi:thiamine-monophosphate kinase
MIKDFYEGIGLACEKYGADLAGGDVTSSLTGMSISCTTLGRGRSSDAVYRNGAGVNDLICVTGDLGAAYMGLQVLERERVMFEKHGTGQPVLEGYDYIIGRQLKPEARKDITGVLREMDVIPTSMTDISGGLSAELIQLCMESRMGCRIYPERIPVHHDTAKAAEEFNIEPVIAALHGGEDYELLFTVKQSDYPKIVACEDIRVIGHIVEDTKGIYMITGSGEAEINAAGWNSIL